MERGKTSQGAPTQHKQQQARSHDGATTQRRSAVAFFVFSRFYAPVFEHFWVAITFYKLWESTQTPERKSRCLIFLF